MKYCASCKTHKQLLEFSNNRSTPDGRMIACKVCMSKFNKRYYIKNKEKVTKYQKEWYIKNKEKIRPVRMARNQWNYLKNQKKDIMRVKEYRKKNLAKVRFSEVKRGAKIRNYEFSLTFDEFLTFFNKPCSYCGSKIKGIGLDRIDNTRGYFIGNVEATCLICNRMKDVYTKPFFIEHIKQITEFLNSSKGVK